MNILIVSQYFYPENFRINEISRDLKNRGHNVTVLTGTPNYPAGKFYKGYGFFQKSRIEYYEGVKIIRCKIYPRKNGSKINLSLNYLSFALSASLKILSLGKEKYDSILVFAVSPITVVLPAILFKKLKSTPIITWVQDLWPESVVAASGLKNKFVLSMITKLVIFIYNNSNKILVSSEGMIGSIIDKGINKSQISYLPQWAEDIFENKKIKKNSSVILPKGFKIVFAGNIGHAQDIPSILKAAKELKIYQDIHFIFIGSGSMFLWLSEQINENSLSSNVHLLGSFPLDYMPYFYNEADALLVSLGDNPIWSVTVPGKIQSYLCSGKPILTMINGEASNIINKSNAGLIASSGDYIQLSKNILKLKSFDENTRLKIGQNGKNFYNNNFRKDLLMKKLEQLLS